MKIRELTRKEGLKSYKAPEITINVIVLEHNILQTPSGNGETPDMQGEIW